MTVGLCAVLTTARAAQKGDEGVTAPKKRYHALRLAMEANRIAVGCGAPQVWFPPGPEREELLSMRAGGGGTEEEFLRRFNDLLEPTRSNVHGYPATSDVSSMEPMLVRVRMQQLERLPSPAQMSALVGDLHGDAALRQHALDVLNRAGLARGSRLLFVGISGSHLHGTATQSSLERDVVGIFVGPIERALGFEVTRASRDAGGAHGCSGEPNPARRVQTGRLDGDRADESKGREAR